VAVVGMSIAAAGMLLLARMDAATTMTSVTINLVIFGLGTGMVMPLFPIIVQNVVTPEIMGAATAALSFFRALGGTVGVALLGSLLNSTFARLFAEQLPPAVRASVGAGRLATLNDPAALLSSQALERLKASFAQFGPQGQALLAQVLDTIRAALAVAIHDVYLAGTALLILATVLCLFLREIPLRRAAHVAREGAGSAHEALVAAE